MVDNHTAILDRDAWEEGLDRDGAFLDGDADGADEVDDLFSLGQSGGTWLEKYG